MIVLLLRGDEVDALLTRKPDKALLSYLARQRRMESLLPDDRLPEAVLLRRVEAVDDPERRCYAAVIREYDTTEDADRAWDEQAGSEAAPVAEQEWKLA